MWPDYAEILSMYFTMYQVLVLIYIFLLYSFIHSWKTGVRVRSLLARMYHSCYFSGTTWAAIGEYLISYSSRKIKHEHDIRAIINIHKQHVDKEYKPLCASLVSLNKIYVTLTLWAFTLQLKICQRPDHDYSEHCSGSLAPQRNIFCLF